MSSKWWLLFACYALIKARLATSKTSSLMTSPSDDNTLNNTTTSYNNSLSHASNGQPDSIHEKNALLATDSLLFLSMLDGTLNAVSKTTGNIIWMLNEDPVLKIPVDFEKGPVFVANPKDGSLYSFKMGFDGLKKLPFSIPDLVTVSPCKSADGLLYTGSKTDAWFNVDPLTGIKIQTLNMDGSQQVCPSTTSSSTFFIGRTEYKVVMFDSESRQPRWNATFMDYSSHVAPNNKDYDLQHFASSSSGVIVTMDPATGKILWSGDFRSPVVAMYTLNRDHGFQKVPFFTVAKETLYHLTVQMSSSEWRKRFIEHGKEQTVFYPTIYVGEHNNRLYALPSLVDVNTVTVTPKNFGPLLLEGPSSDSVEVVMSSDSAEAVVTSPDSVAIVDSDDENLLSSNKDLILLGYHEVPDVSPGKLYHPSIRLITDKSTLVFSNAADAAADIITVVNDDDLTSSERKIMSYNRTNRSEMNYFLTSEFKFYSTTIIFAILFTLLFIFFSRQRRLHHNMSSSSSSETLSQNSSPDVDGLFSVGKIKFNPKEILGYGCAGTFVYRGTFDRRDVAVKRLLPDCFSFADREVDLLRESDQHQNVIRYYCTEEDAQFRYIALELCIATVHDYIEKKDFDKSCISSIELMHQMISGINHLHSLNIVHRDVKPQNVLLSQLDAFGKVHAMISDFGLCKKLSSGRHSLSKRSGVTGTDGWIAPEMINHEQRVTCAVDIFSAGCVMYYVMSEGLHPFSDSLHRQANIQNGIYNLFALEKDVNECVLAKDLLSNMMNGSGEERPTAEKVLKHLFFWSKDKQLTFFEAVSDKLDKLPDTDRVVMLIEAGGLRVVKSNWSLHITDDLRQDLRKFRSYKTHSVRDLLRAIRNKHHHYGELGLELQKSFGQIPDQYVDYFTSRFPLLLLHTYNAMSYCSSETNLHRFY